MGTSVTSTGITFPDSTTQTTAASGGFAAGTIMLFRQTAAPTGWTKDTTNYDGSAIRVVTGTVSSGGTVAFTTAFASQAVSGTNSGGAVAATTLSTAQLASHSHGATVYNGGDGVQNAIFGSGINQGWSTGVSTGAAGSGSSHTHTFTQPTFTGTAINLAVKYVDCIFATKA